MLALKDPKGTIYTPSHKKYSFIAKILAVILCILVTTNCYLYLNSHFAKIITGASMYPTLNSQTYNQKDIVLVNKYAKLEHGDIIIINTKKLAYFDNHGTKLIIKRIIGLAGDRIKIIHNAETGYNEVWRNGEKLQENYVNEDTDEDTVKTYNYQLNWYTPCPKDSEGYITIPEGQCFFLGDNRNVSLDSRAVGPLDYARVLGVVDCIVPDNTLWHDIIATLCRFDLDF